LATPVQAQSPTEVVVESPKLTVEEIIIEQFKAEGIDTSFVLDIVREESEFNERAYNPEWHKGCQGSYGLFQIACVNYSGNPTDLYDPELNAQIAIQVYKTQGWRAWGVCREKVRCYN
jgi:soluble lytic murein transglycosylase-like protein